MRVDAHAHVTQESWVGEGWWQGLSRIAADVLPGVPAEFVRENVIPPLFDPDGSNQLGAMEAAGIDVAVMFPFDWTNAERWGPAGTGWREQNAWYRRFAESNPGRIRWGFGADPRHDGALEAFRRAVEDAGAVCLKLHPGNGFHLNDPVVYPFVEAAGKLGVPVVLHTGPVETPGQSKFAQPILLDDVAADFPDVRFVAAHTGKLLWREAIAVASVKPNVYCELSGWQLRFQRNPDRFYADVREVLDVVGAHRMMWGTDGPYYRTVVPDDDYLRAFSDAPEDTFTPEEIQAICGGTAAGLFGLA